MQHTFRDDEPLSRPKTDRSAFQVNGQFTFDHVKELIIVIVFVPVILTLDDTDPDN
jgi:hypothetical protein